MLALAQVMTDLNKMDNIQADLLVNLFSGLILGLIGTVVAVIRAHFEQKREQQKTQRQEEHYKNEAPAERRRRLLDEALHKAKDQHKR